MAKNLEIIYVFRLSDLRKASYYLLFLQKRIPILIMLGVLLVTLVYVVFCRIAGWAINAFLPLLAAAYAVWGLILFARNESAIRSILKTDDSPVGKEYHITIDRIRMLVKVENKEPFSVRLDQLVNAMEMSSMFLLFQTADHFYIIPSRSIDGDERNDLRKYLSTALKGRFQTRFS